jgi:hypothetical protein
MKIACGAMEQAMASLTLPKLPTPALTNGDEVYLWHMYSYLNNKSLLALTLNNKLIAIDPLVLNGKI